MDQYYKPWQNKIDSILEKNSYIKNKNWKTLIYEGHEHNEQFWNSRVDIPLKLLFGKDKKIILEQIPSFLTMDFFKN